MHTRMGLRLLYKGRIESSPSMFYEGVDAVCEDNITNGHMRNQPSENGQQKEWGVLTCLSFWITPRKIHYTTELYSRRHE